MSYIENRFYRREKKSRRNYFIEEGLYAELEGLAQIYDVSVAELINAAIDFLIKTENVENYVKNPDDIVVTHTLLIRQSNLAGLEKLKGMYNISIYKLVNIAIRNLIIDEKSV